MLIFLSREMAYVVGCYQMATIMLCIVFITSYLKRYSGLFSLHSIACILIFSRNEMCLY